MRHVLAASLILAVALGGPAGAVSFQGLGIMSGFSQARTISGDGSVVVLFDGGRYYLRTGSGSTLIGSGVNVFGASQTGDYLSGSVNSWEAARWNMGAWQQLGWLAPPGSFPNQVSHGFGISDGGDVEVGLSHNASGDPEAFRWSPGSGMVGLGFLDPTDTQSIAHAVSGDGEVVVGEVEDATGTYEGFRWTPRSGMKGLGVLPGYSDSRALGISANGSTIVGLSQTGATQRATAWTCQSSVQDLGRFSPAYDASRDGEVVVGGSYQATTDTAWIWTSDLGGKKLTKVLRDYGLRLSWSLTVATAISDDGCTVVGAGINPSGLTEAWLIDLTGSVYCSPLP